MKHTLNYNTKRGRTRQLQCSYPSMKRATRWTTVWDTKWLHQSWQRGWHLFAQINLLQCNVAGSYFPFQIWSNPEAEAESANIFDLCISSVKGHWIFKEWQQSTWVLCVQGEKQFGWCFVFKCVSNVYKGNVFYLTCSKSTDVTVCWGEFHQNWLFRLIFSPFLWLLTVKFQCCDVRFELMKHCVVYMHLLHRCGGVTNTVLHSILKSIQILKCFQRYHAKIIKIFQNCTWVFRNVKRSGLFCRIKT